jgi:hypothetical protein
MDIKSIIYEENFFYSEEFRNLFAAKVYSQKKIRIQSVEEVSKYLKIIWDMCDYVNGLPEGTSIVCGRHISDFMLPEEIKDFFIPNSVRVDPSDRRSKDVLIRAKYKPDAPNYNVYLEAISYIRGIVKRTWNEGLVSLESVRKDVSINDIFSRVAVKDSKFLYNTESYDAVEEGIFANYDGSPYVSIAISNGIDTYTSSYWNEYNSTIAEDLVAKFSIY